MQKTDWNGLSADERDSFVNSLVEYGTDFVAPLYSVVEKIEETLQQKNSVIRAQADARPMWQIQGTPDSWLDVDEETWKWSDESRRRIVYTRPEASAPGLSVEDAMRIVMANWGDKAAIEKAFAANLTRASAATVAEPGGEEPLVVRLLRHELGVALKCLSEAEAEKVSLQVQLQAAQQQAEPGADEREAFRQLLNEFAYLQREIGKQGNTYALTTKSNAVYQRLEAAQSGQRAGVADTAAARDVLAERIRHLTHEGWTPVHDDEHANGNIGEAAICYIQGKTEWGYGNPHQRWPWALCWWKPTDRRRNLVKAGALILAEIERLDRAAAPTQQQEGGK